MIANCNCGIILKKKKTKEKKTTTTRHLNKVARDKSTFSNGKFLKKKQFS